MREGISVNLSNLELPVQNGGPPPPLRSHSTPLKWQTPPASCSDRHGGRQPYLLTPQQQHHAKPFSAPTQMAEGVDARSPPQQKAKHKFSVYQNPAFSAALTAKSLQPSKSVVLLIFSASVVSATALLVVTSRLFSSPHLFLLVLSCFLRICSVYMR